MKNILFILLIFLATSITAQDSVSLNQVSIQGSSNINNFELFYPKYESINSELTLSADTLRDYKFIIPVSEFIAMNHSFYNNFLKLVKAEKYPLIEVIVPHKFICELKAKQELMQLQADVTLAGVQKETNVDLSTNEDNEESVFNGQIELKLSDFNIKTPEKLFGICKVRDQVFINFRINL